ncbi:hypothetical protein, partial [Magnetospirillum sp. SS-4]|uniref:hypothetical protein n=1 Tax=Magnetospirillum sp. SS-4 TaxID=2681465 RepID=UPI0015731E46
MDGEEGPWSLMRNNIADIARLIIISPEFVATLIATTACIIFDKYAQSILSYFPWDTPNFILGFFAFPTALVVAAYNSGTSLLSKNRRLLLDSGLYIRCKNRVIFGCVLTIATLIGSAVAYVLIKINVNSYASTAAALISSGWISSMISVSSIALADFTIKEIEESN